MKTKNITLKIDEATYHRARVRAAENGTSVSAMVREFLESGNTVAMPDASEERRIAALRALYRKADRRARARSGAWKPLTREEIYAEGVR